MNYKKYQSICRTLKWTPSQGQFFLWVKVYFSLSFSSLIMQPSWQLLYPNKSLQAFFLPEIDVASQNCKTQNTPLTLRVIPEQFQTTPGRSFRTSLISITSRWRCYPYSALYRPYWFERHGLLMLQWMPYLYIVLPGLHWISQVSDVCARHSFRALTQKSSSMVTETSQDST